MKSFVIGGAYAAIIVALFYIVHAATFIWQYCDCGAMKF